MSEEIKGSGISEIISTILMLGIAIALFSVVSMFILSYPFSTPSPQVDIVGFIDETDIIWEHHGGPSLDLDTNLSITINGGDSWIIVGNYLENDLNGNNKWDIGERVIYPVGDMTGNEVEVMVIDLDSNSIVMMGVLQDGLSTGEPLPPSLQTSVDAISPYKQIMTPVILNASGDLDLDNISLYYRWSETNWSASWTTLTFDDFESGFGSYTDGGGDCYLYTGGVYAHQGNNAADIQDNRGDASSFYHTSGIDVATPGYTSIKLDFWFYAVSMDGSEDWWIQYYDGSDWNTVADYDHGIDFVNNQFYRKIIWINETDYTFPTNMKIKFICDASGNADDIYIDEIYINATTGEGSGLDWTEWPNVNNPDTSSPWEWNFNFPNGTGYYEFYSVGRFNNDSETEPSSADASCHYDPASILTTSVDNISPYEQTSSPLHLTATGGSSLDNVSLWYRWSDTNWSASWTTLTFDGFESGFGNYTDGGGDCYLYTGGTRSYQGYNSVNIQDNSGDASSFYHTSGIDVATPGYTSIKLDFWFYAVSMDGSEDWWIQYYDGSDWNTVADYDHGIDFVNNQFYHKIIWINETNYNFPIDMRIKFQCDASNNGDDIYIDQIYVNATTGEGIQVDWTEWPDANNPDTSSPWEWNFNFPNGSGYYEFYSIGKYEGYVESEPTIADSKCCYNP